MYVNFIFKLYVFHFYVLDGDTTIDLVFLVDGSSDVTENNFRTSLRFVKNLAKSLNVSSGDTRVALIIYAEDAQTIFDLSDMLPLSNISLATSGVQFPNKPKRNVGLGLGHAKNNVIATTGRIGVPKIVINVQNLKSHDGIDVVSQEIRADGIKVIGIGSGDQIVIGQLKEMAFETSDVYVKNVGYDVLDSADFVQRVKASIFSGKL